MFNIVSAFRLNQTVQTAVVGAGGKTTAVFAIARGLPAPVWVAASAHMGSWQLGMADRHFSASRPQDLDFLSRNTPPGVSLFTGELIVEKNRVRGLDAAALDRLHPLALERRIPLVIEADGSRRLPLKAPAGHEPPIPAFVDHVIVVAGLSALGKPLADDVVYGVEQFAALGELEPGQPITPDALRRVLAHAQGGLKNIPPGARRLALLNQYDVALDQESILRIAPELLQAYDAVAIASLSPASAARDDAAGGVTAVFEPVTAVVLAAGASARMGAPKLLLPWRGEPVIRSTARTALAIGAQQVIVVTGAYAEEVNRALADLPVSIVHNPDWPSGQASSLVTGLRAMAENTGAALFMLGDQPHLPAALPQALIAEHARARPAVLAPAVQGRRGNPVLFDRITFPDLLALKGDEGGRQIMRRHPPALLPWDDEHIFWDLDTPEDYQRLLELEE